MKPLKYILIIGFVFFSFAKVFAKNNILEFKLQEGLDKIVADAGVPGAAFSAIVRGLNKYSLASGYADIEKGVKMAPRDRMFSGSIGKTYAAAMILQLAAEGKLDLDDPAAAYFRN